MFSEISCWHLNWDAIGAVGAWVGGIATAGAALWGVYVAKTAWNSEKKRRQVRIKSQAILMVPELAHTCLAATALFKNASVILGDHEKLSYVRSRLVIDVAKEVVRSNGEISEGLAVALSEFVAIVLMLQDSIDRWAAGPIRGAAAIKAIKDISEMVRPKGERLAEQLALSALGSQELLDAAMQRQEKEGVAETSQSLAA